MVREVRAFKDQDGWFIDDDNGFTKWQNQLVEGIPELIESWVGTGCDRVLVRYADVVFTGAWELELVETDDTGSTYQWQTEAGVFQGWLCAVFFWYFPKAPQRLFLQISAE